MRAPPLLAAALLTGCVTGQPGGRDAYYCRSREAAQPGWLTVDVTLQPGRPASDFRMRWETAHGQPGAYIRIETWTGTLAAAPRAYTTASVTFALPGNPTAAEHRLELRNRASSRTIARSGWIARGMPPAIAVTRWGQLRDNLARGGVEAVIVDRSGRILARDTIWPEVREAPSLGAETARRRWAGLIGNRTRSCPEGTTQMQLIVVNS